MHFSAPVLLAVFCAAGAVAEVCTASSAVSWEALVAASKTNNGQSGSGSSGSSSSGSSSAIDDLYAQNDHLNSLADSQNAAMLAGANLIASSAGAKHRKRATLNCVGQEACLSLQDGSLFCLDFTTTDFHDTDGTVGNLLSGDYQLADGRKWNLNKGPLPSATTSLSPGSTSTSVSGKTTGGAARLEIGAGVVIVAFGMLLL